MRLIIEHAGDQQIARDLLRIDARVMDARPAFAQIINDLERIEGRQFDSQGGYGSGGWQPLAAATVARKQAQGLDPRILHAKGDLSGSLTGKGGDGLREVFPSSMAFGSRVPYAKYHQTGTGRMPQRQPLELPEGDRRAIPRTLQRYFFTGHAS